MRFLVLVLTLNVLLASSSLGQTDSSDYGLLARFSILRHGLRSASFGPTWEGRYSLQEAISTVSALSRTAELKYSAKLLWQYEALKLIQITDETNFQLHGLDQSLFLIDTLNPIDRYHELSRATVETFISQRYCKSCDISDSLFLHLVDLFNQVFLAEHDSFYSPTRMMNNENDLTFLPVTKVINPHSIFRIRRSDKLIYHQRIYKRFENVGDTCEYWLIQYNCEPGRFWVDSKLLLRGLGIKGE